MAGTAQHSVAQHVRVFPGSVFFEVDLSCVVVASFLEGGKFCVPTAKYSVGLALVSGKFENQSIFASTAPVPGSKGAGAILSGA